MLKLSRYLKSRFLLLLMCILLIACSKITEINYGKIKAGMSLREVVSILGQPTHADTVDLAGVIGTTAVWSGNDMEITIQLFNDKVTIKNLSHFDDKTKPVEIDVDA